MSLPPDPLSEAASPARGCAASAPSINRAFVLGAGLGTRLKRLTELLPKPLIPLAGKPLITFAFDHLIGAGIRELVVNTHHRAAAYQNAFPSSTWRGVPIAFRHEPELLETAGGIKNVEDLLGDAPFLVYNGDVLATLPLQPAIAHHLASGNEVTLLLRSRGEALHVAFEAAPEPAAGGCPAGRVSDIRGRLGRAEGTHLFTGIYLVSPAFLRRIPPGKGSVIPLFLAMIEEKASLGAIVIDEGEWWDLGTREQVLAAHRRMREAAPSDSWIAADATVAPDALITGASYVGAGSEVGRGARLHDTILWEGTRIAPGSILENCIVTTGQEVGGTHSGLDF